MKKLILVGVVVSFMLSGAQARDVHSFVCNDSDYSSQPTSQPGKTNFVWTRNGDIVFDRTFTDAYSPSRESYITFYCEKNVIRYRMFGCLEPAIAPLCQNVVPDLDPVLNLVQSYIDASPTLLDGDGPKPILRYEASSLNGSPVRITGLNFMNNIDGNQNISELETTAASQYRYTLKGPSGTLASSVTTNNGRLYFDLSQNPLTANQSGVGFELEAEPIAGGPTDNSSIEWELDLSIAAKGVTATQSGEALLEGEVSQRKVRSKVFSRGLAGLKLDHHFPLPLLAGPSPAAQPFYRLKAQNISSQNEVQLSRLSIDMRLIGVRKNGGFLSLEDISVVEIADNNAVVGTPNYQKISIEDSRKNEKTFVFTIELADFKIAPNSVRYLEFRVANTINDALGRDDDDGVVAQMRTEESINVEKSMYSELNDAMWVWTDFSGELVGGQRNDWRSGLSLELDNQPVSVRE